MQQLASSPAMGAVIVLLLGQFLVLLSTAGYVRRALNDHDNALKSHDAQLSYVYERLRQIELEVARAK